MHIHLLKTTEGVKSIFNEWQFLLSVSDCHRTFSSQEWFLAVLDTFTEFSPWLWVARDKGRIKGIAPLVINNDTRQVSLLSDLADYQDFIVASKDKKTAISLLQAIIDQRNEFSDIVLSGLRKNSIVRRIIDEIPSLLIDIPLNLSVKSNVNLCYYADLSTGFNTYINRFSANRRSNFRRIERRAQDGNIELKELLPKDISGEAVVEHFLRLHLMRFPDKLFSRVKPQKFCRSLLPVLFINRSLRVFVLQHRGEVLAIKLAVQDVSGLGFWNGGFDPKISAIAPGKLLMLYQVRVCCDEGIPVLDLLRGEDAYKTEWATGYETIAALQLS